MTRILFWCDSFWPNIGGVEVLSSRLVTALRDRGHELAVITRWDQLELPAESEYHGIPIHRLRFLQTVESRDALRWLELRREVATLKRRFAPDLVYVYHATFDVLFHLETRGAAPVPTLCTFHGAVADGIVGEGSTMRRVLIEADWVTACSEATLLRLRGQVPEIIGRSSTILNGLEPSSLPPVPAAAGAPSLLCVGRIGTAEKGFDLAVDAFARLASRFPRLRLVIAGDGAERAALERQALSLGVGDRVDFRGWVNPASIPALIAQSTVVLMPSRAEEGFGLVVLQAAHMERPVVAARVGGLPEVIVEGETGLLVDSEDVGALERAVSSLLENPDRAAAMGRAARRRALIEFTWERHVDAYDDLICRLAHGPVAARSTA